MKARLQLQLVEPDKKKSKPRKRRKSKKKPPPMDYRQWRLKVCLEPDVPLYEPPGRTQ